MAAIYVSSTFNDLKDHRAAVREALRKLGHVDIAMEHYVAESKRPLAKCLSDVRSCDLYVGVFAWRYGYIPKGSERSITEKEFREAVRCEKSTLLFLVDKNAEWPSRHVELEPGIRKLQNLRADIEAEFVVDYFSTPSDLAVRVSTAVAAWNAPLRTPQEVEREHRLMRSWLYAREPVERERARQALRNMASTRYIALLRQFLMDEQGTPEQRVGYLADIVALCGSRPETITTLLDLFENGDERLKGMAIFQIGEIWLAGRNAGSAVLSLLPRLAETSEPKTLYYLIHAVEKLIRTQRYDDSDEQVPSELVECLETMAETPAKGSHNPARSRHSLDLLTVRKAVR